MKLGRLRKDYRSNASNLHMDMGQLLRTYPLFAGYRIYQEYPVNRLTPYADSARERFDWVVMDLKLVIEMHGQQHYHPVRFGNISIEEAEANLHAQQARDEAKRSAVESAGWMYIVFKYDEEISIVNLLRKMSSYQPKYAQLEAPASRDTSKQDIYRQQQLEKARTYRKQKYQELKRKSHDSTRHS